MDLRLGFFFLCTAVSPVVGEPGVSLSPGGILVVTFECQTLGGTNRNEDRRNIEFNIEKTRNAKAPLHKCPGKSSSAPLSRCRRLRIPRPMFNVLGMRESKYREDVRSLCAQVGVNFYIT